MPMKIVGIGTAVPPHRIAQMDALEIARSVACDSHAQGRLIDTIYRRSGVQTRHSVLLETAADACGSRQSYFGETSPSTADRMTRYACEASDLAMQAASGAIEEAGIDAKRVTHLITVSCTGFHSPGVDLALMKRLGLSSGVERTHVGFMGCHGLLNGLRAARAFVEADPKACVLVCAVELCSLHMQYGWEPERVVANALFADGAAAFVGLGEDSERGAIYQVNATASTVIPETEDAMSWTISDHGFAMTLSSRVPDLIATHLRPWLDNWLASHAQSVETVGSWAVHPGGPRILSAFAETAGIPQEAIRASYDVLSEYGNMSSPTVLFILDRLRKKQAARPCVAIAFGPGLTVEAALLG